MAAKTAKEKAATAKAKAAEAKVKAAEAKAAEAEKAAEIEAAANAKAVKALDAKARTVSGIVGRINKQETRTDDLRLTLAQHLAEAEKICAAGKVKFKDWVEANVEIRQGYAEVRRLVKIGNADDPKKALEDLRAGVRDRVKKHSDKKKAEAAETKKTAEAVSPAPPSDPAEHVLEIFGGLSKRKQLDILKTIAKDLELEIVHVPSGKSVYPPK